MNLIRCEVPERSPWDNRFYADPFLLSVGEDSFQIVLQLSAREADKERGTEQNECYTMITASPPRSLTDTPSDPDAPGEAVPPRGLSPPSAPTPPPPENRKPLPSPPPGTDFRIDKGPGFEI